MTVRFMWRLLVRLLSIALGVAQVYFLIETLPTVTTRLFYGQADGYDYFSLATSLLALGLLPSGIMGVGLQKWWGGVLLVLGNVFWFAWLRFSLDALLVVLRRL